MKKDQTLNAAVGVKINEDREITKAINSVQKLREMVIMTMSEARTSADNLFGEELEKFASGLADIPSGDVYQLHFNLTQLSEELDHLRYQVSRLSNV